MVESQHRAVNPLADDEENNDGMQVEGTLGTLDEEAIQSGMAPRLREIAGCFDNLVGQAPYLGGQVSLQLRVGRDGTARRVKLTESSLGSLTAERCILKAARGARFGRPRGGEAEVTFPLTFTGRIAPVIWNEGMVKDGLLAHVEELLADGGRPLRAPQGLVITFYVDPGGRVVSAGMIAEEPIDEKFADRLVENLKKLKLTQPSGGYAKVTYPW